MIIKTVLFSDYLTPVMGLDKHSNVGMMSDPYTNKTRL